MQELLDALTWTFIHSLWQGFIAALLAAGIISATLKTSPKLRYNLLCLLLVSFLIVISTTFALQFSDNVERNDFVQHITVNKLADRISKIPDYTNLMQYTREWINNNNNILLIIWMIFFLLNTVKLVTGFNKITRLKKDKTHQLPAHWNKRLMGLKNCLGIDQQVTLLQSELIKIPVAIGLFKPIILLPIGLVTRLPVEQVEAILLHELAHIKRRDYLINIFQHLTETIFFFNPGIMWISSLVRREREVCCDEIVVNHSKQKQHYLNALVSFEEYSYQEPSFALSLGNHQNQLMARVKRIVTSENRRLSIIEKLALCSALFICSAFGYVNQTKHLNQLTADGTMLESALTKPTFVSNEAEKIHLAAPSKERKVAPLLKPSPNQIRIVSIDSIQAAAQHQLTRLLLNSAITDIAHVAQNNDDGLGYEREIAEENAAQTLQKIINLKEEIGGVKAVIEVLKSRLNPNYDQNEVMKALELERKKLSKMRFELEQLRARYEKLKKEEASRPKQ